MFDPKSRKIIAAACDELGIGDKTGITEEDRQSLLKKLEADGHDEEYEVVSDLEEEYEFEDFIVNEIYDGSDDDKEDDDEDEETDDEDDDSDDDDGDDEDEEEYDEEDDEDEE